MLITFVRAVNGNNSHLYHFPLKRFVSERNQNKKIWFLWGSVTLYSLEVYSTTTKNIHHYNTNHSSVCTLVRNLYDAPKQADSDSKAPISGFSIKFSMDDSNLGFLASGFFSVSSRNILCNICKCLCMLDVERLLIVTVEVQ